MPTDGLFGPRGVWRCLLRNPADLKWLLLGDVLISGVAFRLFFFLLRKVKDAVVAQHQREALIDAPATKTFSLKWLFLCVAAVALLCGWIADHRRMAQMLQERKDEVAVLDRHWSRNVGQVYVLAANDFAQMSASRSSDKEGDCSFAASDGKLAETVAYAITASGFTTIYLERVTLSPEAQKVLALLYDVTINGDDQVYRRRRLAIRP